MVSVREELWRQFRGLVLDHANDLEVAPVREAPGELERQGLSLDVIARVVHEKLGD